MAFLLIILSYGAQVLALDSVELVQVQLSQSENPLEELIRETVTDAKKRVEQGADLESAAREAARIAAHEVKLKESDEKPSSGVLKDEIVVAKEVIKALMHDNSYSGLKFQPSDEPYDNDAGLSEVSLARWPQDASTGVKGLPMSGPRWSDQWLNRLLVHPKEKFAFCWIDKNAGTEFNLAMNALNEIEEGEDGKEVWPWWYSNYERLKVPFSEITKENGWKLAIFIRDPAERFLSAWASKCVQMEEDGESCIGKRNVPNNDSPKAIKAFEKAVRLLPTYMNVARGGGLNSHYDPQTEFCGGRAIDEYDFVGHLTGDHEKVYKQIKIMFEDFANVGSDRTDFWDTLSELFPLDSVTGHSSNSSDRMQKFYRDPEIYQIVTDAYEQDYIQLPLKRGVYVTSAQGLAS